MISPDTIAGRKSRVESQMGEGTSYPLGATVCPDGVNFSVFSRDADTVDLLLFDRVDAPKPSQVITLDPGKNRTYHYWHIFVPNVRPGQIYTYRAIGPPMPREGLCFDPEKLLLDPYGRAVAVPENYSRQAAMHPGDSTDTAMKSVVVDTGTYDWEGDQPLHRSFARTVIYEMHVRGFTRHPNSGVEEERRGTYSALMEKIPYLGILASRPSNYCPFFSSTRRTLPRAGQLLGVQPGFFLLASPGVQFTKGPARRTGRVP